MISEAIEDSLTEDQSDWIKFGYEESQIDLGFSRKGAKGVKVIQTLVLPLPFAGRALPQK